MLAVFAPLPQWVNFLAMFVAVALVLIGGLLWVVLFRKKRRRKHHKRRRQHEQRKANPTLAESGGLPSLRPSEKPGDQPPPP
jgi:cytochrome c-type biogenesis protein CcmH/NrfF